MAPKKGGRLNTKGRHDDRAGHLAWSDDDLVFDHPNPEIQDCMVDTFSGWSRLRSSMIEMFKLVGDPDDAKATIDVVISFPGDLGLLADFIVHFTGSLPTFQLLPERKVLVKADGFQGSDVGQPHGSVDPGN